MKWKTLTIRTALLLVTIGIGWLICERQVSRAVERERTQTLETAFLSNMERATASYLDDPPQVAAGAIRAILGEIDNYVDESYLSPKYLTFSISSHLEDLALMHSRLARLYERIGGTNEANQHVALALGFHHRIVPDGSWRPPVITNRDMLFRFLDETDSDGNPYTRKL